MADSLLATLGRSSFFYGMEPLLQPRHPLEKYHRAQLDFLAALPEEARAEHARLFRLGNATYCYQQQAHGAVTEADFHHWLEGLLEKTRAVMEREGVEASQNNWPLRHHALERRDPGQEAFLQAILSPEDWAYQQQAARAPCALSRTNSMSIAKLCSTVCKI